MGKQCLDHTPTHTHPHTPLTVAFRIHACCACGGGVRCELKLGLLQLHEGRGDATSHLRNIRHATIDMDASPGATLQLTQHGAQQGRLAAPNRANNSP